MQVQGVAARVLEHQLVADARVDDVAHELDALGLERLASGRDVGDLERHGHRVRLELLAERRRVHDRQREVAGLELHAGHVAPLLALRQLERLLVELHRGLEIVGGQGDEVDAGDHGTLLVGWNNSARRSRPLLKPASARSPIGVVVVKRSSVRPSPTSAKVTTLVTPSGGPKASRSGGTTSCQTPSLTISSPASDTLTIRNGAPGRTSRTIPSRRACQPRLPHQRTSSSGSVQARHRRSRGASKTRTISVTDVLLEAV